MSILRELHTRYMKQDKMFPVVYYTSGGNLIKGHLVRFLDGFGVQIDTGFHTVEALGINTTAKAGPSCEREWCLADSVRAEYARMQEAFTRASLEDTATEQMVRLFGDLRDKVKDIGFYQVKAWPMRDPELLSGYVSTNAGGVGQPFCGWLVYKDGNHEFVVVENVSETSGIKLVQI